MTESSSALPPAGSSPSAAGSEAAPARDHRVAVFAKVSDPHILAELLARVLGEHPLDALMQSRRTPSVLPVRMTAEQAAELVRLLDGVGWRAASVADGVLPDLENAMVVHHARFEPEQLVILDLYGAPSEAIPWERIAVLAIGEVPGEPTQHYPDAVRPSVVSAAPLPSTPRLETPAARQLELWLLTRHPARAYRLDHRRFNYDCLEERKTASATANFELFARLLSERATSARWTPSTHAYLCHESHSKYEFASAAELQEHALVHWVIDHCVVDDAVEGQGARDA
uniref:Uncharacterized protein n=1 Tax=Schlesneria paludicola TaxID=360056 RepID=A0A7C4QGL2_9PLAN